MFQRLINIFIIFLLIAGVAIGDVTSVSASTDVTPPTVKSIKLDKTNVQPGDIIKIEVDAEDLESGISDLSRDKVIGIRKQNGDQLELVYLAYNSTSQKYEGTYIVPSNAVNGIWYISSIRFIDKVGNEFYEFPKEGNELFVTFTVTNGVDDVTPPTVNSIMLDKTNVQPGDIIKVEVDAEDLESGISDLSRDKVIGIRKQNGDQLELVYLAYNSTSQKYEGTYIVPSNAVNGIWYISSIRFIDKVGNEFYEFPKEGNKLFVTFTVTNGVDDVTPPTVNSIKLDKTNVQPGDIIKIEVDAEDLESGISDLSRDKVIGIRKQNGDQLKLVYLVYNSTSQLYEGTYIVPNNTVLGIWYISSIRFIDKVGNEFYEFPKEGNNLYVTFRVTEDIIPPDVPTVNEISDKENIITGTSEAKSTIIIKAGTTVLGTGTTTVEGEYSVSIPIQKANTKLLVTATDESGNTSDAKEVTVKDVTAPTIPIVNEVTDKTTSVSGTAEEGSTITIKAGTTVIGTVITTNDGKYTVAITKQKAGTKLTITATDVAGNTSEVKEITVKDETAPTIPTVNEVTDQSISVTGTAEIGSLITVKTGTTVIGTGTTSNDGKYSVAIQKQKADSKIAVTATDESGNMSLVTEVIVKDVTGPTAPVVNEVTDTSTSVSGTAEPGSSITIKEGTLVIGTGTTTNEGKYSISIPKQKAGSKLAVTAMDTKGNISPVKEITVKDETAPTIPTVIEVTDASTNVIGTAEAGSSITIKTGTTVIGTGTTTNEGKYSVTISKQKAGTKLAITAKDAAGNTSEVKEVTVKDVTAPTLPVVNEVTDKAVSVTGSTEAGSTVAIKAGNNLLGTAKAAVDGKFSIAIEKQLVGTVLNVSVTDGAGNVSATVNVTVIKAPAEKTNRIAGASRYSTAVAISQEGWETAETVVLATGVDFPDALAGGPLAYKENAPILLTKPTSLTSETEIEIKRLKAKKVIILGSIGAISLEVEAKLENMGVIIERIGGKNRFDTAALIAKRLPSNQAVIAYGFNFPDVLSISPYAAKNGIPILLTKTDKVPLETKNAMLGKTNTIIVGSSGAVNDSVMNQFPNPVRFGGKTRYETGKEIITKLSMGTQKAYVATGLNFPDALAGSVLAAKSNAPILLVNSNSIPTATNDLISNYDSFSIFGSKGAVSEDVQKALDVTLQ